MGEEQGGKQGEEQKLRQAPCVYFTRAGFDNPLVTSRSVIKSPGYETKSRGENLVRGQKVRIWDYNAEQFQKKFHVTPERTKGLGGRGNTGKLKNWTAPRATKRTKDICCY